MDEIQALGYDILAFDYRQYYYQNVFWTATNCTEYRQPVDDNGNPISSQQASRSCLTSTAPGSGPVQSTTGYVVADQYREGMWRDNAGWIRILPVNSDGTINWGAAAPWTQCCSGTAPRAQGDYVVGNTYYQNVFWTETNCTEYVRPLDNNGNLGATTTRTCRTTAPGSGTIQSYTAYVVGDYLREGMWRNNVGYIRNVPLNSAKTDVLWSSAPAWSQCCSGTAPQAQGVYILNHP